MIQDIAPKHLDNTWKPRLPEPDDTVFDYDGRNLFLKPDQTFFHVRDLSEDTVYQYLFSIGEEGFFRKKGSCKGQEGGRSVRKSRTGGSRRMICGINPVENIMHVRYVQDPAPV